MNYKHFLKAKVSRLKHRIASEVRGLKSRIKLCAYSATLIPRKRIECVLSVAETTTFRQKSILIGEKIHNLCTFLPPAYSPTND